MQVDAVDAAVVALNRLAESYIYNKYKPRVRLDTNGGLTFEPVPPASLGATDVLYRVLSPFYLPYFLEHRFAGQQ